MTSTVRGHRPAVARARARPGLRSAALFVVAAGVTALFGVGDGFWIPLHLLTVGALLTAIVTSTVYLAVTWSAAAPPGVVAAATPRWLVGIGAVALAVGRAARWSWMLELGAVAVAAGVAATVPLLLAVRGRSTVGRFRPAIDAYLGALGAGTVGALLGYAIVSGRAGTRWVEFRDAHLTLNLFGLVGVVVAGTIPYFAATQMRAKMPARASGARIRATVAALTLLAVVAAIAQLARADRLAGAAIVAYASTALVVIALCPTPTAKRRRWAGPRLVQLGAGLAWWAAGSVGVGIAVWTGRDDRDALLALVIGGYAQILVASLSYLGPVVRGGGHEQLGAGFRVTGSWPSVVAGNVAAVAALAGARTVLAVMIAVWTIDVVTRSVLLVRTRPRT